MKNIKVLLLYPPEQSWPGTMVKPNGSLAYPYLGGALKSIGVETYVYDACVGNENDNLDVLLNHPSYVCFQHMLIYQHSIFHNHI